MKITRHIVERYCERILAIPAKDIERCISLDYAGYAQQVESLIKNSTLIFQGQVGKNKPASYFINKDIMIVCSFESKEAITLYQVDLPFPPRVRRMLVKELVLEIKKKQNRALKVGAAAEQKCQELRQNIGDIEDELVTLRSKINALEDKKKSYRKKLWEVKNGPDELQKEVEMMVSQLVGQNQELVMRAAGVK